MASKGVNRRILSIEEMNDRRSKGLCYFCPEKYMFGHKCKNLKQLYLLEVEEIEELGEDSQEVRHQEEHTMEIQALEQMEISVHVLNGSLGYRTLKVTGYHAKKPLHILIDTGSSHNFIDPELVKVLGCEVRSTLPQNVATANGNDILV